MSYGKITKPIQIQSGTINQDHSTQLTVNTMQEFTITVKDVFGKDPQIFLTPVMWASPREISAVVKAINHTQIAIRVISSIATTEWAVHWLAVW